MDVLDAKFWLPHHPCWGALDVEHMHVKHDNDVRDIIDYSEEVHWSIKNFSPRQVSCLMV